MTYSKLVSAYFMILMALLVTNGFWNYLVASTPLVVWKQAGVFIAYLFTFTSATKKDLLILTIVFLSVFASILLAVLSYLSDIDISVILRSIGYYNTWVPFFAWSFTSGKKVFDSSLVRSTIFVFLIGGTIGLYFDLKSEMFAFMQEDAIGGWYYEKFDVAKRSAFIFVASTLVMPVQAGLAILSTENDKSAIKILIAISALIVSATCTGSASGAVIAAIVSIGLLIRSLRLSYTLILVATIPLAAAGTASWFLETDLGHRQVDRILENRASDSEANSGRIAAWVKATEVITRFAPEQHMVGVGLGRADARYADTNEYLGHGESSFFQAYIEGGLIGLLFRVAPFILIGYSLFRRGLSAKWATFSYCLAVFIGVSIAPTFGNMPFQAILGVVAGGLYRDVKVLDSQRKQRKAELLRRRLSSVSAARTVMFDIRSRR